MAMVFRPMALAMRMRCRQYSAGMRAGCISPPIIWNGLPSSRNCEFSGPPKVKACGLPSGAAGSATATLVQTRPSHKHAEIDRHFMVMESFA